MKYEDYVMTDAEEEQYFGKESEDELKQMFKEEMEEYDPDEERA